jgi:gamma-glutamylcyclotransferase (GGCT)/AIG2-like uncharacterized protein YtfP
MHVFAYGVLMKHEVMRRYCPDSRFLGPGWIQDFELIFDGQSRLRPGAVANIEPAEAEDKVWGGLYEASELDLVNLDDFEGYPKIYQRKVFTVQAGSGQLIRAHAYFRKGETPGLPGKEYLADVIQGAEDCDLPIKYIENLRSRATV